MNKERPSSDESSLAWCDKTNPFETRQYSYDAWQNVLLAEDVFYEWRDKGASIRDMLEFARLRPVDERVQAKFAF